jgi:hypothetical protein
MVILGIIRALAGAAKRETTNPARDPDLQAIRPL